MFRTLIVFILFLSDKVRSNKYCAFELDGEAKYYVCPRNEYCCNFGCCVNLAFQFYQLWYYWLLIIFMFMICSGGGWWYRFCRQSDTSPYPAGNSGGTSSSLTACGTTTQSINGLAHHHSGHHAHHVRRSRQHSQRPTNLAGINRHHVGHTHNLNGGHNGGNAVSSSASSSSSSAMYLQRLWKGPTDSGDNGGIGGVGGNGPASTFCGNNGRYNGNTTSRLPPTYLSPHTESILQNAGLMLVGPNAYRQQGPYQHGTAGVAMTNFQQHCPYFQLYGPPPSYDSVVQICESGIGPASCSVVTIQSPADTMSNIMIDEPSIRIDDNVEHQAIGVPATLVQSGSLMSPIVDGTIVTAATTVIAGITRTTSAPNTTLSNINGNCSRTGVPVVAGGYAANSNVAGATDGIGLISPTGSC